MRTGLFYLRYLQIEKANFEQNNHFHVFHFFVLFAYCCNLVYISDIACGLEFGFSIFKKTGDVTTLIYAALIPFFLVSVYKVYVLEMP